MTTARRIGLPAAAAALALVATAEATNHWLPGERWADGRVRDTACSVALASGNHCYDALRPSSSSVPWALGGLFLAAFAVLSIIAIRPRRAAPRFVAPSMAVSGVLCGMALVTLLVRAGDGGFGPLDRDWAATGSDKAWLLIALIAVLALRVLTARASRARHVRGARPT